MARSRLPFPLSYPPFVSASFLFPCSFFLASLSFFVPLAEAVIFAMLASYMWSRTIVPTLAMYLLSAEDEYHAEEHLGERQGFFRRYQQKFEHGFENFREAYRHALQSALDIPGTFSAD